MATSLFGVGDVLEANNGGTIVPQSFIGTAGQTVFVLTNFVYVPGTNSIEVFINGSRQTSRDFTELSSTSFALIEGVQTGDFVDVKGIPAFTPTAVTAGVVTYTNSLAGGTIRTGQDKFADWESVKDFTGIDVSGVIDSSVGFAAFITAGGGLIPYKSVLAVSTPQILDISTTSLTSRRTVLNYTGVGSCLTVYSSTAYPLNDTFNTLNVIEGIAFRGSNVVGQIAVQIGDPVFTNNNEITFRNCSFSEFETILNFLANSWRVKFENCIFFHCNFNGTGKFINFTGLANSGEVMTFERCAFFDPYSNSGDLVLTGGQWIFDKCSFGGGLVRMVLTAGAVTTLNACNFEYQGNNITVSRMIIVSGASTLNINGGAFILNAGSITWTVAPLQIDDTSVCNLNGVTLPAPNANITYSADLQKCFIQGTSPYITVQGLQTIFSGNVTRNCAVSVKLNSIVNGDATQTAVQGWSGAGIVNSVGNGRTGNSLRVTGAATPNQTINVTPGRTLIMMLWAKVVSGASGNAAFPQISFLDRSGAVVISTVGNIGVVSPQVAYQVYCQVTVVPAQASIAIITLDAQAGYVIDYDDVIINQV